MSSIENVADFKVAISEIVDVGTPSEGHPFLTVAKFIFADDQPNQNNQAVNVEEFPNIIASAIGMPVKMNYTGIGAADHGGSVPIGHIRSMEHVVSPTGTNQLVAEAVLWKDEYPEEVEFLKTAFAEGRAPGISYELGYKESILEKGVQWLKSVATLAATFVRKPAYGSRTHLLALASLEEEERNEQIVALAESITTNPDDKGGNNQVPEPTPDTTDYRAEAAAKQTEIDRLLGELKERDTTITTLTGERDGLKQTLLLSSREKEYTDAGFTLEAEAAEGTKEFWSSLNDTQWQGYLSGLIKVRDAAKPAAPTAPAKPDPAALVAQASANNAMPRVEVTESTVSDLKGAMRNLARPIEL